MERVPVDILGLSTSPASGGAFALILREMNGNRRLPIIIGAAEAQSIALEMEGIKPPRPLTHDLMKNIITAFGADRAMFESNFPVDKGSYSYGNFWNACKRLAQGASASEKASLFHGTASKFYRLSV